MAAAGNFLTGMPGEFTQLPLYNQQQQGAQNNLLSQIAPLLQKNQQNGFAPIAQRAQTNFQTQTIPTIAERFVGSKGSGAYRYALQNAGRELNEGLAALESQYNLKQGDQLTNLLGLLLRPQNENIYHPAEPGALSGISQGFGQGLGNAAGEGQFGSGLGALAGGALGSFGGPIGTAIGGAAGGGLELLLRWLLNRGQGGQQQETGAGGATV